MDELAKEGSLRSMSVDTYGILLQEVVESVTDWLNDLWILAVEHQLDIPRVHSCLVFSFGILDHVQSITNKGCES